MHYKEKYLKYKIKYLKLKNQIGGTILAEGTIVKTLSNNGERENMVYQCFWISILNFLNFYINRDLSLKELRTNVGLDENTERTMFDSFNPVFNEAAQNCAFLYNLTINIYAIDRDGKIKRHSGTYGNGENIVNIAMFGQSHFELIVDRGGDTFIPAIIFEKKLQKINEISEISKNDTLKEYYLELSENQNNLDFFKNELQNVEKKIQDKKKKKKNKNNKKKKLKNAIKNKKKKTKFKKYKKKKKKKEKKKKKKKKKK